VSNEIKFFDVVCTGSAHDLKELRRLMKRVFKKRVKHLHLSTHGRVRDRYLRIGVEAFDFTTVDYDAIQRNKLEHRGIALVELAADGSPVLAQEVLEESTSPIDIPVSTISVPIQAPVRAIRLLPVAA